MKNLLQLTFALLLSLGLFSQEDSTNVIIDIEDIEVDDQKADTTTINLGKMLITITEDPNGECESDEETKREQTLRLTHWSGFDLGMNGLFFGPEMDIEGGDYDFLEVDLARSRTISFNFAEEKLRIFGDHVGIFTGLGLEYNNYALKNDYTLLSNKDTTFALMDSTITLRKNKLRTTWINVPLMLEINTSLDSEKNFHLAAGLIGGWRIGSKYKQKFKKDGDREKVKSNKDFNLMDYKVDAAIRMGYGNFTLFATYALTEMFEENKTTEIHPFSVGIQLVGF